MGPWESVLAIVALHLLWRMARAFEGGAESLHKLAKRDFIRLEVDCDE
jgi:hypothetical protein